MHSTEFEMLLEILIDSDVPTDSLNDSDVLIEFDVLSLTDCEVLAESDVLVDKL